MIRVLRSIQSCGEIRAQQCVDLDSHNFRRYIRIVVQRRMISKDVHVMKWRHTRFSMPKPFTLIIGVLIAFKCSPSTKSIRCKISSESQSSADESPNSSGGLLAVCSVVTRRSDRLARLVRAESVSNTTPLAEVWLVPSDHLSVQPNARASAGAQASDCTRRSLQGCA